MATTSFSRGLPAKLVAAGVAAVARAGAARSVCAATGPSISAVPDSSAKKRVSNRIVVFPPIVVKARSARGAASMHERFVTISALATRAGGRFVNLAPPRHGQARRGHARAWPTQFQSIAMPTAVNSVSHVAKHPDLATVFRRSDQAEARTAHVPIPVLRQHGTGPTLGGQAGGRPLGVPVGCGMVQSVGICRFHAPSAPVRHGYERPTTAAQLEALFDQ